MITDRLLWLDLETTGLDPTKTAILEVGAKIVSNKFEILAHFHRVVRHTPIPPMDAWCLKTHNESGLLKAINTSESMPLKFVELGLCSWLDTWFKDAKGKDIILCGNSIHFDRSFIRQHMPLVEAKLHYRMLNVTSVYLFETIFRNKIIPKLEAPHRVLPDIDASINLLRSM